MTEGDDEYVGVPEVSDNITDDVEIFPVPSHDLININIKETSDINIYNVSGQLVHSLKNENEEIVTINVSDWKKSVYFVEIIDENLNKKNGKFVVK